MSDETPLLAPGETCWRTARADRLALLVDGAAYFAAAKAAMINARKSIWLLAWVFDPLTRLTPDRSKKSADPAAADRLGLLLRRLASLNPGLDVRILAWDMPWLMGATQWFPCQRGAAYFLNSPVKYRLDDTLPRSACHHQKVLVIDGKVGFVSGGDLAMDRWDTAAHGDHVPERRLPTGRRYPARHEVSAMVEGPAVDVLSDLFVDRWKAASGETPPAPARPNNGETPWPSVVEADIHGQTCGVARTSPRWRDNPGAEECLALHLRSIASARELIYLENQYLTAPLIVEALAQRLDEPDGPEIVVIGPSRSPSYFDRTTMDSARVRALNRLIAADRHGRFSAYIARTREGHPVIVHAKVCVIDDRLLRLGSANLNNRSIGLDSECDVAIEADNEATSGAIRAFRHREIAHFLGREPEEVGRAVALHHSLGAAIEALDRDPRRLQPVEKETLSPVENFIATRSLGDPIRTSDAWRPWLRRRHIAQDIKRLLEPVP